MATTEAPALVLGEDTLGVLSKLAKVSGQELSALIDRGAVLGPFGAGRD
jgi:hypothetical protein